MNIWSFALVAMIVTGAVVGKYANASSPLDHGATMSGEPVTTLRTPATP